MTRAVAAIGLAILASIQTASVARGPSPGLRAFPAGAAIPVYAAQRSAGGFSYERPITAAGAGPQRLEVDVALMSGASPFRIVERGGRPVAEGGLGDLRLFDLAGGTVPYLLVHPPAQVPEWLTGRILPLATTEKSSGVEVDLGAGAEVDMIRVEGLPAPFLKRFILEGSGDRARWTMLAPEGTFFDLPDEGLRQLSMPFAHGRFRYVRLTWDDTNSGRVPVPRSIGVRRRGRAPSASSSAAVVPFERRASEPGRSRYLVWLPAARLPIVALDLVVGGGHVFRPAVVMESRLSGAEAVPVELGRATLTRIVRNGIAAGSLRIPVTPPAEAELQLLIEDGGNPPLELAGVAAVLAELPWIYFETTDRALVARYGDPTLERPFYDLEAVRGEIDLDTVEQAMWEAPHAVAEGAAQGVAPGIPDPGAALDAASFRYARTISDGSGLTALALDAEILAHSRGPSERFRDVRVLDGSGRQIPYVLERRDEPLSIDLTIEPAPPSGIPASGDAGDRHSRYLLALPAAAMPPSTVVLETSARVFHRTVRIGIERPPDRRHRGAWLETIASATWRHTERQHPAPGLTLRLDTLDASQILVLIDEGDNAPLPIVAARLLLPSYRLRFYHPGSGSLRLVYGRTDLSPPQYDLALLAPQLMGAAARELTVAPESGDTTPGARPAFISPVLFWILLGGSAIVLVGLIARLILRDGRP